MITDTMRDFGVFDGDISTMCIRPIHVPTLCEQHGIHDMRSIVRQHTRATRLWLNREIDYKTFRAYRDAKNVLPQFEYLYK